MPGNEPMWSSFHKLALVNVTLKSDQAGLYTTTDIVGVSPVINNQ